MNVTVMSGHDLVKYARPTTELEHALLDALREAQPSLDRLEELERVIFLQELPVDADDLDTALDKNKLKVADLERRIEELEEQHDAR